MKRVYLILLLSFLFNFSYGQISIRDLDDICHMKSERFEIFAMDKGYIFSGVKVAEDREGICMKEKQSKYNREIIWYSKYRNWHYMAFYYSESLDELQVIYKDINEDGFELIERNLSKDGYYIKRYRKDTEELATYIEIHIKSNYFYIYYSR